MTPLDKLKADLRAGRVSRRRFMEGALALGLAVPAAEGLMAQAKAATPQTGGTFRQALTGGSSSDSMNPATILDSYMINVSSQLRNNLTEIGPDNLLRGELATEWEATPDAATWTFKLRDGVEFHNGKSLTTEDVVQSFRHHMGPDAASGAAGIVAQIEEVKADGPDRVVFVLKGGNADFPYLVSAYHLAICPAVDGGGIDANSGVGTGGYIVESYEPGGRTLVRRNPNYWKADAAFFDSIENLFIADPTARTNALRSGEVDCITNLDPSVAGLMGRDPNIRVVPTYGNKHGTLPMNTTLAPFDNNDVRLALKYAIDRKDALDKIAFGYGELGNDHPIGPANIFRATEDEIPQREFDPDRARYHLRQAGLENLSVDIHLADSAFTGAINLGQLFAETARTAGINIRVVREPDDGYWSDVWLVKPWVASYWGGRPTEDWMFSQVYSSGADWNEARWENERFNQLLVEARVELDQARRRELYVEMQRLVRDDGGSVIPLFLAFTQAVTTNVGMPEVLASNWELDGHKNGERWWFV
ncbi:MAG: ABC transporter substrate-binding protein [Rhodobacteraceae bacterium]|nr:MAG: ABC transporter substrate-binding protein [Paracoccaceae bacterium]